MERFEVLHSFIYNGECRAKCEYRGTSYAIASKVFDELCNAYSQSSDIDNVVLDSPYSFVRRMQGFSKNKHVVSVILVW